MKVERNWVMFPVWTFSKTLLDDNKKVKPFLLAQDVPYTEWIIVDGSGTFKLHESANQRDAIIFGLNNGLRPESTNDVRPRQVQGGSSNRLMTPSEFRKFLSGLELS